ncbi:MAG: Asp-tRNA(Asn)/Glu-tRNA(Gln) amidotransferase subunit GatC [Candidatus Omnitrophota bacterium]|nr:Asp-tRNA(Asn)/Glu-tRNA(Gln) amidotransferase subunit GatC [Candidatus Omnitrophota bacterium]
MVDKEIVEYVANLARIQVSEEEKEFLSGQLSKILGYIDKLKELDVEKVEPMRGLHLEKNIFRKDEVRISGLNEDILKNAPSREGDYFKVPKIIE